MKIKDITHRTQIRFKPLQPHLLNGTNLTQKGVQNILSSCYSRFFEEQQYFFIYVTDVEKEETDKKADIVMIVKKERELEGRTDIIVENIIPGTLLINTGIMTRKINDFFIQVDLDSE